MRRPGPSFRRHLATQLAALLVPWSVLVAACLALAFHRQIDRFQRERDDQVGHTLAHEVVELFHDGNSAGLDNLMDEHGAAWPALRYMFLLEASGDLIWSSMEDGTPAALLDARPGRDDGEAPVPMRVRLDGMLIDDFLVGDAGMQVRVGFDVGPARQMARGMLPILGLTGLVGLLVVGALATWLSRPVEDLDRAVRRALDLDRATRGLADQGSMVQETAAIAASFDELVDRLEDRTRQLDSARKLAWLGEISTSIAHDVNNPLGVAVLNAGFLVRRLEAGEMPRECEPEVRRVWQASRRAALVVQKFLQYSRYSAGVAPVRHQPVDLPALLREAAELLEDRLRRGDVRVSFDLDDGLGPVSCDEQGVMQVVLNLVSNAIDASPAGAEVLVRARADGETATLEVVDRGHGMTKEVLARIAEPFFTTRENGTGLGVAISACIVRSHGGTIRFESEPMRGTRATVELPLRRKGT